jgi:hypothetical protein
MIWILFALLLVIGSLVTWILLLRSTNKWLADRSNEFETLYRHAEAERRRLERESWEQR